MASSEGLRTASSERGQRREASRSPLSGLNSMNSSLEFLRLRGQWGDLVAAGLRRRRLCRLVCGA